MAFLDNSGDIILDAVLTDTGRMRLAKGDGSFTISKFGLADDEIDYTLYNKLHPSGSSYYDLEILQTPVLEAFTDNAGSMHYNLVTYNSLDHLFLPVMILNESEESTARDASTNTFMVCADNNTIDNDGVPSLFTGVGVNNKGRERPGFLFGSRPDKGGTIALDQGLNTTAISPMANLPSELVEDTYTIQMDSRLATLATTAGASIAPDYTDDDDISYYTVTEQLGFVSNNDNKETSSTEPIAGPRGTRLKFRLAASMDLQTSSYLFLQLGGTTTLPNREDPAGTSTCYYIDSNIKIVGMNTGCSITVPVRFIKLA